MENTIEQNIFRIKSEIEAINKDVTLVCVSKTIDVPRIKQAVECGLNHLGENRPQELVKKNSEILNIFWHLIGQLQKNKVKYIIDKVYLIHSLDRLSLAQEIQRQCELHDTAVRCLLQVNVSKEETKSGVYAEDLTQLIEGVSKLDRVHVKGLMTIAPFSHNPEDSRVYFARLKALFDKLSATKTDNFEMEWLSMGMSADYKVAVQEGANMVRIGSSIFGSRN